MIEDTSMHPDNISSTSSQKAALFVNQPIIGKSLPNTTKNGKSSAVEKLKSNAAVSRPPQRRTPYTSKGKKKTDLSLGSNGSGSSTGSQSGD